MTQIEDDIMRKSEAEAILRSALHQEAWNVLTADLFNKWSRTGWSDKAEREQLYLEMRAMKRVEKYYESIITTGQMAKQSMLQKLKKSVTNT